MCTSKPKVQTATIATPAPAPTVVATDVSDSNSTQKATETQRKKKGYASTKAASIETILGAVAGNSGAKNTLG